MRADREAEARGLELLGVMHSHTHTDAYPSPTDLAQAPDPGWHYVIVSLRQEAPVLRSYRDRGRAQHRGGCVRRSSAPRIPTDESTFVRSSPWPSTNPSLDLIGNTPIVDIRALSPNPKVRILAKLEGQNPGGSVKDRAAKQMIDEAEKDGLLHAGLGSDDPGVLVGQHRHRPGDDLPRCGATRSRSCCPTTSRSSAASCSRSGAPRSSTPRGRGLQRRHAPGPGHGRRAPRLVLPVPVRQPRQPQGPLRGHRPRDLARRARDHPLHRRARHRGHADGRRPLPQGAEPRRPGLGHRAAARARWSTGSRTSTRASSRRCSSTTDGFELLDRKHHRAAPRVDRVDPPPHRGRRVRRHLVGGDPGRRGASAAERDRRGRRSSRSCATAAGSTSRPARGPTTSTSSRPGPRPPSTSERPCSSAALRRAADWRGRRRSRGWGAR